MYFSEIDVKTILQKNPFTMPHVDEILEAYNQPHRYFHGMRHLQFLFSRIFLTPEGKAPFYTMNEMVAVAAFHDIVYVPGADDNEILSAEYMRDFPEIATAIRATRNHVDAFPDRVVSISRDFNWLDLYPLHHDGMPSIAEMMKYEHDIFKEFQKYSYVDYRNGRVDFLSKVYSEHQWEATKLLIEYVKARVPKVGIYAGSFNPFHKGHMNILQKAD